MSEYAFDAKHESQVFTLRTVKHVEFLKTALNQPTYVRLEGSARSGTIGIVDFAHVPYILSEEAFHEFRRNPPKKYDAYTKLNIPYGIYEFIIMASRYEEYLYNLHYYADGFRLRFDDGKVIKTPMFRARDGVYFTWLTDYMGPTVNVFTKKDKSSAPTPVCEDKFGTLVSVGDLVASVKTNDLVVGVVEKIVTSGKSVYLKPIGQKDTTVSLFSAGRNIVVINDQTRNTAMLHKLSS